MFETAGCKSCHTLKDAGATGTVGPNLDQAKPPLDRVVDRVTNGKGVMPSFSGQLSEQQIADVAAYVVQATRADPPGDFPRGVQAFACDLDRTLIGEDAELRPRTRRRSPRREAAAST